MAVILQTDANVKIVQVQKRNRVAVILAQRMLWPRELCMFLVASCALGEEGKALCFVKKLPNVEIIILFYFFAVNGKTTKKNFFFFSRL